MAMGSRIENYLAEAERTKTMWEQMSNTMMDRRQNKTQAYIQSTPQGKMEDNIFQQAFMEQTDAVAQRLEKHPEQVIEEIFHLHKELYDKMRLDAESSMIGTSDMILHIVKEYYEPTAKDNSVSEINRALGFMKPPNYQVDMDSDEIPF